MSKPKRTCYRTTNWSSYNAALKKRGCLTVWFDPSMNWEGLPTGRRGRQRSYSDAAIQACLTLKVLFGFALRQTTGFVESLLRLAGLAWSVPDFSTLSRRQKALTVDISYRSSDGPLHLLIDSTGIKVEGEGEWHRRKHGGSKHRIWRKLHIAVDEGSLEIRAVEMTRNEIGDAPVLPMLLEQIPQDEDIASVTADGAYDTRRSHDTIAERGAQAIIPPRKNAKTWCPTSAGAITRNETLRACRHLGRAIWRRWSGYHRRSRVETKMHCIKLLGQRLTARDFDRQITEVHVRIAVLNRFTALGIPLTHPVA
ncbi:IS5 family transposase [Gluconobacter frateurii]|uniref:IS5 family transposase n=1 Tax=Gluconobacter frateurii TaxID=38308 RepID=UPI001F0598CE|nr:IS5 family transposase [Gluconobacter frateurii]UMM07973.1 IS5 family transposase [Gluconobacter frateurii]